MTVVDLKMGGEMTKRRDDVETVGEEREKKPGRLPG